MPPKNTTNQPDKSSPTATARRTSDVQKDIEDFRDRLPPELAGLFDKAWGRAINDALNGQDNPAMESFIPPLRVTDSEAILGQEFAPLRYVLEDYLPVGLAFLAGKPKVKKSWLALQIAKGVITGKGALDKRTDAGRVLYLALEDNPRRLNDRMKKQKWPRIKGVVDFLFYDDFHEQIGSLHTGAKQLIKFIGRNEYRLVVIDTFSRAFDIDQLDAKVMTAALGPLQQAALRLNICLLLIDHLRKGNGMSPDMTNDLYGSVAKSGVADTLWTLYKEQGKRGAKLTITGKDVAEHDLKLEFDDSEFSWQCLGDANLEITPKQDDVLKALKDLQGWQDANVIADHTGQDVSNVRKRLNDLFNAGFVEFRQQNRYKQYHVKR